MRYIPKQACFYRSTDYTHQILPKKHFNTEISWAHTHTGLVNKSDPTHNETWKCCAHIFHAVKSSEHYRSALYITRGTSNVMFHTGYKVCMHTFFPSTVKLIVKKKIHDLKNKEGIHRRQSLYFSVMFALTKVKSGASFIFETSLCKDLGEL